MKTLCLMISAFGPILFGSVTAAANNWQVIYQTDFSSDPGWITNDPSRFYWDSGDNTYYAHLTNVNYGGYYAYHDVGQNGYTGGSFKLELDTTINSIDYASGIPIGLFDSTLWVESGNCTHVNFINEDRGTIICLEAYSNNLGYYTDSLPFWYSINRWYHVVLEYNADIETLSANISNSTYGENVSLQLSGVEPFSLDMSRLGISNLINRTCQVPGNECFSKIDNIVFSVPELAIEASIDIDPDTLNIKSKGEWITCYIELPEGYDVADINVSTIMLNGQVPAESKPTTIADYDGDGIADLMVKFSRSAVQNILPAEGDAEITVAGELADGTVFEGKDTIRIIDEGK